MKTKHTYTHQLGITIRHELLSFCTPTNTTTTPSSQFTRLYQWSHYTQAVTHTPIRTRELTTRKKLKRYKVYSTQFMPVYATPFIRERRVVNACKSAICNLFKRVLSTCYMRYKRYTHTHIHTYIHTTQYYASIRLFNTPLVLYYTPLRTGVYAHYGFPRVIVHGSGWCKVQSGWKVQNLSSFLTHPLLPSHRLSFSPIQPSSFLPSFACPSSLIPEATPLMF